MAKRARGKGFDLLKWLTQPPRKRTPKPPNPPPARPVARDEPEDSPLPSRRKWPIAAFLTHEEGEEPLTKRRRRPPKVPGVGRPPHKVKRRCTAYAIIKLLARQDITVIAANMNVSVNTLARWIVEELTRRNPLLSLFEELDSRGITMTLPSGVQVSGATLLDVLTLERDVFPGEDELHLGGVLRRLRGMK